MNKKLLVVFSLLLFLFISGYVIFNQQKTNNIANDIIILETTTTTTVTSPVIMVGKIPLCSNQYYETKYDEDGKVVIKDFPYKKYMKTRWNDLYYNLGVDSDDIEQGKINGVVNPCEENEYFVDKSGSSQGGPPLVVSYRFCYDKDLSLQHISDLTCVQKIELSGIQLNDLEGFNDVDTHYIDNCFFEKDDLKTISSLDNLEEIIINGCLINNNNNWWNELKSFHKLTIINGVENDKVFDNILPIIYSMEKVKEVDLIYNKLLYSRDIYEDYMGGINDTTLSKDIADYVYYDKLCDWIGKGNIGKKFTFLGGKPFNFGLVRSIEFTKDGKAMTKCNDQNDFNTYNSCQEWIEDIKNNNWCPFAG